MQLPRPQAGERAGRRRRPRQGVARHCLSATFLCLSLAFRCPFISLTVHCSALPFIGLPLPSAAFLCPSTATSTATSLSFSGRPLPCYCQFADLIGAASSSPTSAWPRRPCPPPPTAPGPSAVRWNTCHQHKTAPLSSTLVAAFPRCFRCLAVHAITFQCFLKDGAPFFSTGTPLYLSPESIRNMRDRSGYGFGARHRLHCLWLVFPLPFMAKTLP